MQPSLLLATDGTPGALGAVRVAREAAAVQGARVEVVAVHDPSPLLAGFDDPFLAAYSAYDVEAVGALRDRVAAQLGEVGDPAPSWNVTVKRGPVAPMIARASSEAGATLIVLGLRHYGRREHWIGRETPLRVMHLAHVPVLAVPAYAQGLPRRAVIATDLGSVSLGAAREARALLSPGGALHLAHVLPPEGEPGGLLDVEGKGSYRAHAERRLTAIADDLTHGSDLHGHVHLLAGDPGDAVLRLAQDTAPDLIAVGSHSYSLFERLLLGSVASRIVRGAQCAVLVAPCAHVSSDLRRNLIEAELLAHMARADSGVLSPPKVSLAPSRS
jgi:nucleotide-binding universal stress UspA family protein